jgi:hypothetical protein
LVAPPEVLLAVLLAVDAVRHRRLRGRIRSRRNNLRRQVAARRRDISRNLAGRDRPRGSAMTRLTSPARGKNRGEDQGNENG